LNAPVEIGIRDYLQNPTFCFQSRQYHDGKARRRSKSWKRGSERRSSM
jgi:hypothetical protein